MLMQIDSTLVRHRRFKAFATIASFALAIIVMLGIAPTISSGLLAQGTVTGGFEGLVQDKTLAKSVPGARVILRNLSNDTQFTVITDESGKYSRRSLQPGEYEIEVSATGFATQTKRQTLFAMANYVVRPNPFELVPLAATVVPTPGVTPDPGRPVVTPTPQPIDDQDDGREDGESLSMDSRRVGIFGKDAVVGLPLGSTTLTRTFDELAFLVPGVNPPPQAIGSSVGPGVGGGVGTSGQFSVNGLRSRANNFTVDGSDNNDEDIGVRRQGFFTLVPQPIESIQEFQITTLLAPAEFGRNLGAQVNAISKSGGNRFHGSVFGFVNSEKLNARNFFDNAGGNSITPLTSDGTSNGVPVFIDDLTTQARVFNDAGEKDKFTLFQGGIALGGRIVRDKAFFFVSAEGQELDGTQERNFAVPTVAQRGLFNTGATGLTQCQLVFDPSQQTFVCMPGANNVAGFPTSVGGDAVFSLFPFANNPTGVYGVNTYTQALSTDARGRVFSGKFEYNFDWFRQPQNFTARYNNTDDERDLTDVGGALFSAIRPLVRTDNFSSYLSGGLTNNISNELRFSWGRTRLDFEELPDTTGFLRPAGTSITNPNDRRFLLNAPLLFNLTLPIGCNPICFAPPRATYSTTNFTTEQSTLGPIGQLNIAGFSPVGVDVFNFPQERTNNTFQFADTLRWQTGSHSLAFGTDIRRVYLASDLPRNSRPLVTFYGAVRENAAGQPVITSPLDLAASDAATGFFQSLVQSGKDSRIDLSYTQYNFFVQDEWRPRRNLSLNLGLRYEYNSVPKERDRKIEETFSAGRSEFPVLPPGPGFGGLDIFQGFQAFLNGRTQIYDADANNFAPRIGIAWSPDSKTVIRGGYGIYYDQIIGAVVGQSRNVFPTFTTFNSGGGDLLCNNENFTLFNPINAVYSTTSCNSGVPLVRPGTLNQLNPQFDRGDLLTSLLTFFPRQNGTFFGATIPVRNLEMPLSHQYSIGIERQFGAAFLSVAYIGTLGRSLLRFTTPNLGSNYIAAVTGFNLFDLSVVDPMTGQPLYTATPLVSGTTIDPFVNLNDLERPNRDIGPISQFETTGRSRYDSLQIGLRGRWAQKFQYQLNYAYGKVRDDVSDVFDLAGSFALPQNSRTFAGEYAPANFDVRHRFTYNFLYGLPRFNDQNDFVKHIFGSWEMAGSGKFNTGQPFTVNTVFDINHDGNLTDRLDNTAAISQTDNRQNPLSLSCSGAACRSMLAGLGEDGSVGRNSFRAGNVLELDMTLSRKFAISELQNIQFRVDFFNFINRANFGVPVRFLEAPGFGRAVETITPGRRIQFALKYNF